MGHVDVGGVGYVLPDGRSLFSAVSFRVGDGAIVALVGANGTGKTTLLRLIGGDLDADEGTIVRSGGLGIMRQLVGSANRRRDLVPPGLDPDELLRGQADDAATVRDLLVSVAPTRLREAARALELSELEMMGSDDEPTQMRYAHALTDWGDAGGYVSEVVWDACTQAAVGLPFERAQWRPLSTLSGGEQKRLVLEALLRGADEVLLLDEPDNFLDVPGKTWLEDRLLETTKTVLLVSHDRELLSRTATRIVTVEGGTAWTHGGGFATYHDARLARHERLEELLRRWDEEHQRLKDLVRTLQQQAAISPKMAAAYHAMQTRLRKYEEAGPPQAPPPKQRVTMRLRGGRTGIRAITCQDLELTGLMKPFDLEVFYGERVAVLGSNGSGKSHFLRLLAGDPVAHSGTWKLGARVVPGLFAQTHDHPEFLRRTPMELLWQLHSLQTGPAKSALRRYEIDGQGEQRFETLSGGQQARFQILLLELGGATALLLDEPTDNLDLASAEALEEGLSGFDGTVVGVTHDRWFARSFDRFLVFGADGHVVESAGPVWDEGRVERAR
jgi:ATPase subunit of ABC transporter with duplicated ATPase domains